MSEGAVSGDVWKVKVGGCFLEGKTIRERTREADFIIQ
jgi:hypothetical protein